MRLPVNNDDLTTMYESLIEILSKHGEFGDVLSWVETLYSKAKFGQPSEKKALSRKEVYDWGYADGKKAQREVRYPDAQYLAKKFEEFIPVMDQNEIYNEISRKNMEFLSLKAIDEFKKLNGG